MNRQQPAEFGRLADPGDDRRVGRIQRETLTSQVNRPPSLLEAWPVSHQAVSPRIRERVGRGRLSEERIAVYVPTPQLEKLRQLADYSSSTLSSCARRLLASAIAREIASLSLETR